MNGSERERDIELGSWRASLADKPRFQESGCPGNQIWVEGMDQMLACIPEGNPIPALVCVWNGMIFDLDVPQKATQNHTGTYCCTATNPLGSVSKDIAVIVQGTRCTSSPPPWEAPQGFGILTQAWRKKRCSRGLGGLGQNDFLVLSPPSPVVSSVPTQACLKVSAPPPSSLSSFSPWAWL